MAETKDLFMMCSTPRKERFAPLPAGYFLRYCREDELALWMGMHFDDPIAATSARPFMEEYFDTVYRPQEELFFQRCLFVCTPEDRPIASCFVWKAYDKFNTIHWLKVLPAYEGQGIGRALLSKVLQQLSPEDYPLYLHTHPESIRAIGLYSDIGFQLLTDPVIGQRTNDLEHCLPYLKEHMSPAAFAALEKTTAPTEFLDTVARFPFNEF